MRTIPPVPGSEPYGLGIEVFNIAGSTCYGHDGIWGVIAFDCPDQDVTMVSAWNQALTGPPWNQHALLAAALKAVLQAGNRHATAADHAAERTVGKAERSAKTCPW